MPPEVTTLRRASAPGVEVVETDYAPGLAQPRHAHAELSLTLLIRGSVSESVGRAHVDAAAWSISVKPFGVEHANHFGPSTTRTISVKIDPAWDADLERAVPATAAWRWFAGGTAAPRMLAMLETLRGGAGPEWVENAVIDLLAAIGGDERLRPASPPPLWLARARERCIEDAARGVQTSSLSSDAHVHPVSLARAFRRHYGESISECVRRARVQTALRLFQSTDLSLAEVAAESGFADQSHLTRLFRSETGRTPAAMRRLAGCDRSRRAGCRRVGYVA